MTTVFHMAFFAQVTLPRVGAWLLAALAVFFFFSISILIHEAGHFFAAKALGLRADAFSLGFGPALWKKRRGETEFRVCAVPFGGYVALPQLDPAGMEKLQGGDEAQTPVQPAAWWKRIIVAVAGPAGNIVLAIPLAFVIRVLPPVQDPHLDFGGAVVGEVSPDGQAAAAGIRQFDQILEVAGRKVASWPEFLQEVHLSSGDGTADLSVSNRLDGGVRRIEVPVARDELGTWRIGGVSAAASVGVGAVFPGSPAFAAGFAQGDAILSVGDDRVVSPSGFVALMDAADAAAAVPVSVLRDGKILSLSVRADEFAHAAAGEGLSAFGGCLVTAVHRGHAAEESGLSPGDVILEVDGAPVESPDQFVRLVAASGGQPMELNALAPPWTGSPRVVRVTPRIETPKGESEPRPFLGATLVDSPLPPPPRDASELAAPVGPETALMRYGVVPALVQDSVPVWSRHRAPFAQLKGDAASVWRVFSPIFGNRQKGELKRVGASLGGPVMILSAMWMWVLANFAAALGFVRFLNVNLAIVNLLPIPVLDGGHVVFALWRGLTGRELPPKILDALVRVFLFALVAVFVLLSGCDAARLWRRF